MNNRLEDLTFTHCFFPFPPFVLPVSVSRWHCQARIGCVAPQRREAGQAGSDLPGHQQHKHQWGRRQVWRASVGSCRARTQNRSETHRHTHVVHHLEPHKIIYRKEWKEQLGTEIYIERCVRWGINSVLLTVIQGLMHVLYVAQVLV